MNLSNFCRSDVPAVALSRRSAQSYGDTSFRGLHGSLQQDPVVCSSSSHVNDHDMDNDNFLGDDFDDLPQDELDTVVFQENPRVAGEHMLQSHGAPGVNARTTHVSLPGSNSSQFATQKRDHQGCAKVSPQRMATSASSPVALRPPPPSEFINNDEGDLMDEDMDCFFEEEEKEVKMEETRAPAAQQESSCSVSSFKPESDSSGGEGAPALTLTSPPFTYLCLLEEATSRPGFVSAEVRLKAFIMTLLGKLSSCGGSWSIPATISDGTGYIDVELSDSVLTGLLGFSVSEKEALKRQSARRAELSAGMKRCQEELVDMCCIMTVLVKADGGKAVVTRAEPVTEKTLWELERRVRDRKESQQRV